MTKQDRARALYKYGKLYPSIFPYALERASQLYAEDRSERQVST